MFKKDYMVSGITLEVANRWYKELKGTLPFYINKKTGEVQIKIKLSPIGAIVTKIKLIRYNLTHPCVLKLEKVKGRRFRA